MPRVSPSGHGHTGDLAHAVNMRLSRRSAISLTLFEPLGRHQGIGIVSKLTVTDGRSVSPTTWELPTTSVYRDRSGGTSSGLPDQGGFRSISTFPLLQVLHEE